MVKKTLREYQAEAVDEATAYLSGDGGLGGLVVLPTGSGKSLVISALIRQLVPLGWGRILVLAHKRELVSQNIAEAEQYLADMPAKPSLGVCCAGLNSRDLTSDVIFATIQSVRRHAAKLIPTDLVIIDEAHLCSRNDTTMYRKLITDLSEHFDVPVIGMTATPYRLEGGKNNPLIGGETALFDKIVYEADADELIQQGYLTPIVTTSVTEADVEGIRTVQGDFARKPLEERVSMPEVIRRNVDEVLRYGASRRCWLVFCTGVRHAELVQAAFEERGYRLPLIVANTDDDVRDDVLGRLKRGETQGAINVEVATTGFDAPHIDLIAMMRPTKSKSLLVQVLGRGMRLADGKKNCLLLDFGGNVSRIGTSYGLPFHIGDDVPDDTWDCTDMIDIGTGEVLRDGCGHKNPGVRCKCEECGLARPSGFGPTKECGECEAIVSQSSRECPECKTPFLSLSGKPTNIPWRRGVGDQEWRDIKSFSGWAQQTKKGRNMFMFALGFKDGEKLFMPYFPDIGGPIGDKVALLHDLLAVRPSKRPRTAQQAARYLKDSTWGIPKSVVIAKDGKGYPYLADAVMNGVDGVAAAQ